MIVYQLIISAIFKNGKRKIDTTYHIYKDIEKAEKVKKILEHYYKTQRRDISTCNIGIKELELT